MHEKISYKETIKFSIPIVGLALLGFAAFNPRIREWWLKVAGGNCMYEFYNEKNGWQECHQPAKQVHHIKPDGWTRDRGGNPDYNVGMPLCERHHVRNFGEEEHSDDFVFHPDMAYAYQAYHEWKQQKQHMEEITGKKVSRDTSPFSKAVTEHRKKSAKDERYWGGTDEIDDYYEDKMRNKATKYIAETGDKKPILRKRGTIYEKK